MFQLIYCYYTEKVFWYDSVFRILGYVRYRISSSPRVGKKLLHLVALLIM